MTATVNIQLPYPSLEGCEAAAIEHARLNGRFLETFLALALKDAYAGKTVAVFAPSVHRAKFLLSQWIDAKRYTSGDVTSFTLPDGGVIWLVGGKIFKKDELAFSTVDCLYSLSSELITTDMSRFFRNAKLVCTGELAIRGHWFYGYCRSGVPLVQIDATEVCKRFPDQVENMMSRNDPYYERLMHLKDVEPKFGTSSTVVFLRRRVKIRSDKQLQQLSERQREIAAGQYGVPVLPFEVNGIQKRYLAMKRLAVARGKKPWYILLKYRRGGFTTIEQGSSYQLCTQRPYASVATLAHTMGSMSRIFRMVSLFHEKDPEAPQLINDSKSSLEFANGSHFFIGTAGGEGFARGDTLQRVHGSEVSKWCLGPHQMQNVDDLIAGLLGAASNGEVILESTPNGREWFCNTYEDAKAGLNEFTPLFLRWFDDPINRIAPGAYDANELIDTMSDEERHLLERHNLDLAQMAFRRQQKRVYKRLFPQEMPEDDLSCFITSGVCFFDVDTLLRIAETLPQEEGRRIHHPGGYEIRWVEPQLGRHYVAGVDTSEGLPGCDRNGIGILDKETGEQVCSLHGLFNTRVLAEHIVRVCRDYNDAMVGVERENHGHAVLNRVIELGYRRPHFRGGPLFYWDHNSDIQRSRPGWSTNSETRPVMLNDLAEAVEERFMKLHDRDFISEALSFRLQHNGKFSADPGAHDDSVIKWAIAWQMRKHKRPKPSIAIAD
jgi:hypothetical protein